MILELLTLSENKPSTEMSGCALTNNVLSGCMLYSVIVSLTCFLLWGAI